MRASPAQDDQSTNAATQELKVPVDELAQEMTNHHKSKQRSIAQVQQHLPLSHLMAEPVENQQQENLSSTSLILLHSSANCAGSAPAQQSEVDSIASNTAGTAIYATPTMLPSFSHYSAGKSLIQLSTQLNSTHNQVNSPQLNLHSTLRWFCHFFDCLTIAQFLVMALLRSVSTLNKCNTGYS